MRRRLGDMPMRLRFAIISVLLVFAPISVIGIYYYDNITDVFANDMRSMHAVTHDAAVTMLESELRVAETVGKNLSVSRDLQDFLRQIRRGGLEDAYQLVQDAYRFLWYQEYPSIYCVRLIVPDTPYMSLDLPPHLCLLSGLAESMGIAPETLLSPSFQERWMANTRFSNSSSANLQGTLTYVMRIRNLEDYEDTLGYIAVDLSYMRLRPLFDRVNAREGIRIRADDTRGEHLTANFDIAGSVQGETMETLTTEVSAGGILVTTTISVNALYERLHHNVATFVLVAACCALAGCLIVLLLYQNIVKRIVLLCQHMTSVRVGEAPAPIPVEQRDEIGKIALAYNTLLERVHALILRENELSRQSLDMQIKGMQAQINPHFLYNTINTIYWVAMEYKADRVCLLLRTMSDFYRSSLHLARHETDLEGELTNVQLYVRMINLCNQGEVRLKIQVREPLRAMIVPNMLLQPLVENAVQHGIMPKSGKSGTIRVAAYTQGDDLNIIVQDDGLGLTGEAAAHPERLTEDGSSRYGLYHIHAKIALLYGEGYGVRVENAPERGVRVRIRIPQKRSNTNSKY